MKSKNLVRILILLMTVVMFFTVVACGGKTTPPTEDGTTPGTEPVVYADLGGYAFKILGYFREGIAELAPAVGESVLGG